MKPLGYWLKMSLFAADGKHNLLPQDGVLNDFGCVLNAQEAHEYFNTLLEQLVWQHDQVVMFGRRITTARKVAWYGDFPYAYSGSIKQPCVWNDALLVLKQRIEQHTGSIFNACLANLYHDGSQYMGWHSDNEAVLGSEPVIASLSLGASRRFCVKHRKHHALRYEIMLQSGQLLLMSGEMQRHWLHALPKMAQVEQARINLTFRFVHRS